VEKKIKMQKILEKDYQRLVLDWNKLCDESQDVILENRYLRKLANVPENCGIDFEKLKIGERETVDQLKGKVKVLSKELEDAEMDRAKAKHKLINTNFSEVGNNNFKKYDRLTPEQKVIIEEIIQSMLLGYTKDFDDKYDLKKQIETLTLKNEILEKQLSNFKSSFVEKLQIDLNYKPVDLGAIKFKKIDLKARIEKEIQQSEKESKQDAYIKTSEYVQVEERVKNDKQVTNKKEFDDKQSVRSEISSNSTNESLKYSNSIRSQSSDKKIPQLTIQEKLKFTSGNFYHNKK